MINQEAQDHAVACALVARLLGQLTPSFMRLPVLNKNLDKPTPGMALDNIKRPQLRSEATESDRSSSAYLMATMNRLVFVAQTYNGHSPLSLPPHRRLGCGGGRASRDGWQRVGDVLVTLPTRMV